MIRMAWHSRALVCGAAALLLVVASIARAQFYSSDPIWSSSSPHNATRAVVFGDVDGDGDLDVVFANEGEGNALYLNGGGASVFKATAAWEGMSLDATSCVARSAARRVRCFAGR